MKREFLQGLQVGDMPLTKEVIDAIMAENGKDIEAVKARFADAENVAGAWEEKYNQAVSDHQKAMNTLRMEHAVQQAVKDAGGRNVKAITALLDLEAIKESDDLSAALRTAVESLKEQEGYLFAAPGAPMFAAGTGTSAPHAHPATLAGALRERFEKH